MAEDTRPPSDPDRTPTQYLPPVRPDLPGPGRVRVETTEAAWWTRPLPGAQVEPHEVVAASPHDATQVYGYPGDGHPGYGPPDYPPGSHGPGSHGPGGYGPGGQAPTPAGPGRPGRRSVRQTLATQGRRRALIVLGIAGGVPLLAALAVVALLPDPPPPPQATVVPSRPGPTAASRATREPNTVTPSATPTRPSGEPADLAAVEADAATTDLHRAGITVQGTISDAWGWTDSRGRSLVVTITEVTSRADDGSTTGAALRAYYVTGLDAKPTVQRRLKDPSLHCSDQGTVVAGFTPSAFGVRDLDGNGSPEVVVGWTARCGDAGASSRVRLAVMSGTKLYTLRGTGVVTGQALATGGATDPAATDPAATDPAATDPAPGSQTGESGSGDDAAPSPVPAASQWPEPVLEAALAAFHSTFY